MFGASSRYLQGVSKTSFQGVIKMHLGIRCNGFRASFRPIHDIIEMPWGRHNDISHLKAASFNRPPVHGAQYLGKPCIFDCAFGCFAERPSTIRSTGRLRSVPLRNSGWLLSEHSTNVGGARIHVCLWRSSVGVSSSLHLSSHSKRWLSSTTALVWQMVWVVPPASLCLQRWCRCVYQCGGHL